MKKGGYQIIDLENKNLTIDVGMDYEDIYDKIKGTRKAILISGIQIEDTEYHDTFVELTVDGSNFKGKLYGKIITITDTNVVTITEE